MRDGKQVHILPHVFWWIQMWIFWQWWWIFWQEPLRLPLLMNFQVGPRKLKRPLFLFYIGFAPYLFSCLSMWIRLGLRARWHAICAESKWKRWKTMVMMTHSESFQELFTLIRSIKLSQHVSSEITSNIFEFLSLFTYWKGKPNKKVSLLLAFSLVPLKSMWQ